MLQLAGFRKAWSWCARTKHSLSTALTDLHSLLSRSQTVEPGITVPPLAHFPKAFHNMTVRIEDEVLVRKDDCVVLSVDAPKELVDVEACCQGFLDGVRGDKVQQQ